MSIWDSESKFCLPASITYISSAHRAFSGRPAFGPRANPKREIPQHILLFSTGKCSNIFQSLANLPRRQAKKKSMFPLFCLNSADWRKWFTTKRSVTSTAANPRGNDNPFFGRSDLGTKQYKKYNSSTRWLELKGLEDSLEGFKGLLEVWAVVVGRLLV